MQMFTNTVERTSKATLLVKEELHKNSTGHYQPELYKERERERSCFLIASEGLVFDALISKLASIALFPSDC